MNDWFNKLRQESTDLRKCAPLLSDLDEVQEWQRRIIGGSVIAWLEHHGPAILNERQILCELTKVDPNPGIVFTSTAPGLLAAQEILGDEQQDVVFLHDEEFMRWIKRNPDPAYCWHVHFWSFFREPVDKKLSEKARRAYPLPNGSTYWQHSEGTMWGSQAGRGGEHLWQWDGEEPQLLEEAFQSWIS